MNGLSLGTLPPDVNQGAAREPLLPAPGAVGSGAGALLFLLGSSGVVATIYQNSFASPVVEAQPERGQVVVGGSSREIRLRGEFTIR